MRINLDIDDPRPDSFRLRAVLPTIELLLKNGCSITILSHRGRPNGPDFNFGLKPAIVSLQSMVTSQATKLGWLENLRFDPREEKNDEGFARELAGQGDFYVNDDFASSHRNHASLAAVKRFLPSYLGLLAEKEMANLAPVKEGPRRPLVFIIGGSKTAEKSGYAEDFKKIADEILLGSGFSDREDLNPEEIKHYGDIVKKAGTVVWNGPVGDISKEQYRETTAELVRTVAGSPAFTVLGGGSLVDFVISIGLREKIGYLSTGGGAMLAFLAGREMPGLEISGLI